MLQKDFSQKITDPEIDFSLKKSYLENNLHLKKKRIYYRINQKIKDTGAVPDSTGCAACQLHVEDDRLPR